MKKLIPVYVILMAIAAIGFVALSSGNEQVIDDNKENLVIKTYTAAVCEEKEDHIYCRDEFFVNCNGSVSIARDVAHCNGVKVEAPKIMGAAVFEKDWKDPRNNKE